MNILLTDWWIHCNKLIDVQKKNRIDEHFVSKLMKILLTELMQYIDNRIDEYIVNRLMDTL